jgi:hypothetical protein
VNNPDEQEGPLLKCQCPPFCGEKVFRFIVEGHTLATAVGHSRVFAVEQLIGDVGFSDKHEFRPE